MGSMIGISWSSSWSGMNRGTRRGALGASPMVMSARPGTSSRLLSRSFRLEQ
jgi:hypothetical protein